jgi:hypothetical protein
MSSRFDEILGEFTRGRTTLDEACRAVAAAVRQDPNGTRMWPMLIEARVSQQKLSAGDGRALMDALESYEPEKTLWIESPNKPTNESKPVTESKLSATQTSTAKLQTPSTTRATAVTQPIIQDAEQLRAFVWDQPAANKQRISDPNAVKWMEGAATEPKRVPPPRQMPGAQPALAAPELGALIKGRYRLVAHLGFGGIGQVFSALDEAAQSAGSPNPHVTLKFIAVDLKREPQAHYALRDAVNRSKSLRHPNVVNNYGIECDGDRLFVTMEPLAGRWLGELVREVRNAGMSFDVAWPIVTGIAKGLAHAHTHNLVHSDLSPYSVFIDEHGTPKIMGFGFVHALPTSNEAMDLLDTMTLRAYSEAYTADSWATHATPHPADDLYPLGVMAYELLTGKHPFKRQSLTMARQRNMRFEAIPDLHSSATKLITRCLSFERAERPKNATRFLASMTPLGMLRMLFGQNLAAGKVN